MLQHRRAVTTGCALLVMLLAAPSAAAASTVGVGPDEIVGAAITIAAAPGETNDVLVSYDYDTTVFTITDAAGATAEAGCQQVAVTTVACMSGPTDATHVNRIVAHLGDGDDAFTVGATGVFYGASVDGGPGSDTITGGNRPDLLVGGSGDDIVSGGGEADLLLGEDGDDSLRGDAGDDELDGGEGSDVVDAGSGADLVNLREELDGRSGTADPAVTCGEGDDRVALDIADAAPAADCEREAPRFAGVPILVAPPAVVGRTVSLDRTPAGVSGSPAPDTETVWLSCDDEDCDVVADGVDQYALQVSDVGRRVGAALLATNGDPDELGFYAQAVELTDLTAVVSFAPAPPVDSLVPMAPLASLPAGPTPRGGAPTASQLAAARAALAERAMGGAVSVVREGAGLTLYRRAGRRTVTVRGARRARVLGAVCQAPSCLVKVRSELRLTTRRAGRERTRRIALPAIRRALRAGQADTFGVALSAARRRAVRRARSATLRLSYATQTGARGSVTFALRVR